MTKTEIRDRLRAGETLDSILHFTQGQECFIFKADRFQPGEDVIYIPDIDLNEIPVDKDLSTDIEGIMDVLGFCYTGDDFVEECEGDADFSEELFNYVDWQHPSSAYPEVAAAREDEKEWEEAHGAKWPHLK